MRIAIERSVTSAKKRLPSGLVIVGVAVLIAGCNAEASKPKAPTATVQPVQVMTVTVETANSTWNYTGTVRPRFESDVGFRVAGKIVSRHVDIGKAVTAGQLIAKLDETDLQLAVEVQVAELRAALTSREQLVAAEARFQTLLEKGYVAQAALDQRRAAADEARSRVLRAERNLDIARNQLSYTQLEAAAAGVVTSLSAEAGQVVAAGQTVARIAQIAELEVAVAIPEHLAQAVMAATAEVSVWNSVAAEKSARMPARLREMSPDADRTTRTFPARFSLPSGVALELGRTATVHLTRSGGSAPVVRLPISAIMNDGRDAHVFVLDGQTRVRRTAVVVANLGPTEATVSAGLKTGDRVVSMGVHRLDEGQPVRIVDERASTN
ncbi:MAG: efflux RND transporter periplasmic adaptor subunit [Hyphomicrobium aestuarii]|nr:efflux RND transporter periplasmic adaptor subunit [Hyphomicrobium aestuarii]